MAAIENVRIPYGAYWSTPFSKWQNSFADLHSIRFAAHVAKEALAEREIDPQGFDHAVMGITTPQESSFFGLPWLMKMIGNDAVPGTQVSQACATGARVLQSASFEIERGLGNASFCVAMDRTSNGPVLSYPSGSNPGRRAGYRALAPGRIRGRSAGRPADGRHGRELRPRLAGLHRGTARRGGSALGTV